MARELDDRVTAILARVRIFGQLNRVDLTERLEKLADILLSQGGQGPNKPANVDPIILLSLGVLIARRQRVSQRRNVILVRPTDDQRLVRLSEKLLSTFLLFVLVCSCSTVFFSLRSVDHDSLPADLLVAHSEGHEHGLRGIKLHIRNSNTTKRG